MRGELKLAHRTRWMELGGDGQEIDFCHRDQFFSCDCRVETVATFYFAARFQETSRYEEFDIMHGPVWCQHRERYFG